MRIIVVGINEPSAWCLCTKFVQHALASVPINSSKIEILFQRQNTSCEMGGGSAVAAVCLEGSLCNIPIWIIYKQMS